MDSLRKVGTPSMLARKRIDIFGQCYGFQRSRTRRQKLKGNWETGVSWKHGVIGPVYYAKCGGRLFEAWTARAQRVHEVDFVGSMSDHLSTGIRGKFISRF
jgi:hypothetical protein